MLRYRLLSAAVGLPAMLLVIYINGAFFAILVCAIAMIGAHELMLAMKRANIEVVKEVAFPCTAAGIIGTYAFANDAFSLLLLWCSVAFILVFGSMGFYILVHSGREHPGERTASISATSFVTVYACMFSFMLMLRQRENGCQLMLMTLLTVWGADATAYFVGRKFGGRKICERISPGKTISGSVAGALAALVLAPTLSIIMGVIPALAAGSPTPIEALPVGLIGGIFGQLGDMCKSVIKRDLGIKDFGTLIPGHGGVLDRFDSLLISTPLVYFYTAAML
ncbi:MAG: phosphatidate cytidylyltransferase [Armatimonadota bacterium]|nr:phosphatidate cytidylyltransferase [Armatimonadota bacterium]MCX7777658.1 phosphatidate cytidylyltransferase [Armatimonadota bacterium]MDW8025904.1 phosphatidate cytidylyltransferase [Armatimonadota bacterium]